MTLAVVMAVSMLGTTTAQAKKKKTKKTKTKVEYQKPSINMPDYLYLTKGTRVQLKAKNITWYSLKADKPEYEGYISVSKKGIITVNKVPDKYIWFSYQGEVGNKKYKITNIDININLYPEGFTIYNPYGYDNDGETGKKYPEIKLPYTVRTGEYNDKYNAVYYEIKNDNKFPISTEIVYQAKDKTGKEMMHGISGYYFGNCTILGAAGAPDMPIYILPGETVVVPVEISKDKTDYKDWNYSMNIGRFEFANIYWQSKTLTWGTPTINKTIKGKEKRANIMVPFTCSEIVPENGSWFTLPRALISLLKDGKEIGSFAAQIEGNEQYNLRDKYIDYFGMLPDFDEVTIKRSIIPIETYKGVIDNYNYLIK